MISALEFRSVSKAFSKRRRKIQALDKVSFSIDEGEVFGFVGPNGAGKSTTIKILLDIISDYEGEVRIYGTPARRAASRQEVAYLPESPTLYEQLTPLEILRNALRMNGIRRSDEKAWCMQWLERFSVAQYAERRIRQLSKGNVQRVALAHAMVTRPKLLILDEPLSGLDPVGRRDVIDLLMEYKKEGGAIFFTSHVLHDVERIADRFGFINQGKLLTTRSPQELLSGESNRFIVRYRSPNSCITDGHTLRQGEYEYEIAQHELAPWLDRLNQQHGTLLSIHPALSLEKAFFTILNEAVEQKA